eukprot:COSAG06_NODE_1279_length_10030_cov_65.663679_6_plen_113_part_00
MGAAADRWCDLPARHVGAVRRLGSRLKRPQGLGLTARAAARATTTDRGRALPAEVGVRGAAVEEDPALGGDAPRRAVVDLDADGGRHLVRCHRASQGRTGWSAREKAVKSQR